VGLEQVDDTTYDVPSVWSLLQNVPVPSVSALYFTLYQVSCLYYIPCIECLGTKSLVFTTYPVLCVLSLLHTVVSCLYYIPCIKCLVFTTYPVLSFLSLLLYTLYHMSCLYYVPCTMCLVFTTHCTKYCLCLLCLVFNISYIM
jgi:hypothetical protein